MSAKTIHLRSLNKELEENLILLTLYFGATTRKKLEEMEIFGYCTQPFNCIICLKKKNRIGKTVNTGS